ncbi:MAG: M23 family metallopeptidase [Malacoplasma sp.]|nr:M23 family metallopeptidase [Malacoplasma sp.]
MNYDNLNLKQKSILLLSLILFEIEIGLETKDYFAIDDYSINYEYINVKDMATAKVANKIDNASIFDILKGTVHGTLEAVDMNGKVEEKEMEKTENSQPTNVPKRIWYLPTEIGNVTQWPNYGHVAYDITSWRGTGETIHPIANGTISGIYTDSYGALIVTVLHIVDGKKYTSQYVHLSSYAQGIYVGKPVTINDALGQMGTTGNSTGVHLHLAVLDCALFDASDPNCPNLNAWYHYDKFRYSQNFYGLGVLVYVPQTWNSR